jgi:hypothetical protein
MYYSRYFQGLFVRDYIAARRVGNLREAMVENPNVSLREDVQDLNRISVMSPSFNDDEVEVYHNPLLAMKKAPRLSQMGSDTSSTAPSNSAAFDAYDPENEFNDTRALKKNIFQTVKLKTVLGSSDIPLKMIGSHATQRNSDIQLADMYGTKMQNEDISCNIEGGEDDEEELDTFDDDTPISPDITTKTIGNDAHKRGTAFFGYDTAYQKPKANNSNPMQNKVTTKFKDTKHINTVTINEDEESDDALYEEFQAFRNDTNRHSEVGLSSEGDEISFEDWKIRRKELRAKDQNYVNAFRFFERREQETGEKAPKLTASQQRAMGLHTKFGRRASALRQDDGATVMKPEQPASENNTRSI